MTIDREGLGPTGDLLTQEQRNLVRHAIGLDNTKERRSYRNRYHTKLAHPAWEDLVERHLANHADGVYWATRELAEMVLEHGESLDLEDFEND
jgi:hypothetical protein